MSDDLQARYDALVGAAREVIDRTATYRPGGLPAWWLRDAIERLAALLPKPLERDDMVAQADADRVPAGAILRDANGKAVEVVDGGAAGVWFTSGYQAGQSPGDIEAERWPMRVVWLPEDGDQ